jgi:hypothetical protein
VANEGLAKPYKSGQNPGLILQTEPISDSMCALGAGSRRPAHFHRKTRASSDADRQRPVLADLVSRVDRMDSWHRRTALIGKETQNEPYHL